jgi:TonB-linked SusC/RagA family outer membrane protein
MKQKPLLQIWQVALGLAFVFISQIATAHHSPDYSDGTLSDNPQNFSVTGVVRDSEGAPIAGATVVADDGQAATVTTPNGEYAVQLSRPSTLTFSFLGYVAQSVPVAQARVLDIEMATDARMIDDVIVIGYGEVRRADITTAVSVVTTKDIDQRPIISATEMIQGRAAGVEVVTPSGQPGGGQMVRVRGATSILASNDPLYVVDGITMDNIGHISPGDIASMQVLKDASSAAIYGSRAANGVVIITTKRGESDRPIVKLSSYLGLSQLGKNIEALDLDEYKDLMDDMRASGANGIPSKDELAARTHYTDWSKELFRTGVEQNYQLSVQNGSKDLQYYVSAGYTDQTGIVYNSDFQRANLRANVDAKQTDWLRLNFNVSYSNTKQQAARQNSSSMRAGGIMSAINTPPDMLVWDPQNPGQYEESVLGRRIMNPLAANAHEDNYFTDRFVGGLGLTLTPFEGLSINSMFGGDITAGRSTYFLDPFTTEDGRNSKGSYNESFDRNFQWQWDNTVNYAATFADNHNFSAMGGVLLSHAQYNSMWASGTDLYTGAGYEGLQSLDLANRIENSAGSNATAWALSSFVGRVMYDYKKNYLVTVNFRADGSSKFQRGQRWGYFPSASAAWRISGEEFMESAQDVVSDLKLRVGWGLNGNQGISNNYPYLNFYSLERIPTSSDNPNPGFAISYNGIANPRITWETTEQWNAGVDASLFHQRLNISVDAYYKRTTDMISRTQLPTMFDRPDGIIRNDGEMLNKGLEFLVSSRNFTGEFQWNTDLNLSFNRNNITDMGLMKIRKYAASYSTGEDIIRLEQGWALGTFYGYVADGVDPATGDVRYVDLDGDGELTTGDRKALGSAQPDFTFGITNTFSYKGFDLSLFLQGSYGNEIFNATRIETEGMQDFRNQSKEVLRRWRRPGWVTDVPRVNNPDNLRNSSRFVEDGSYIRLKNITLAYSFSGGWMEKAGISRLRPYITAQNLLTLTKYSGYDPEVSAFGTSSTTMGVDFGTYPQNKTFIFGVNIEF